MSAENPGGSTLLIGRIRVNFVSHHSGVRLRQPPQKILLNFGQLLPKLDILILSLRFPLVVVLTNLISVPLLLVPEVLDSRVYSVVRMSEECSEDVLVDIRVLVKWQLGQFFILDLFILLLFSLLVALRFVAEFVIFFPIQISNFYVFTL